MFFSYRSRIGLACSGAVSFVCRGMRVIFLRWHRQCPWPYAHLNHTVPIIRYESQAHLGIFGTLLNLLIIRFESRTQPDAVYEIVVLIRNRAHKYSCPRCHLLILQISVSATREPWSSIQENLKTQIHALIANSDAVASRVAVFPLAPVSACVYAGYLLTNRLNVRGFQYHRDQATWIWPKNSEGLTTPVVAGPAGSISASAEVFFMFELSAPVDASATVDATGKDRAVYRCSVPDMSTGWLKSKAQLDELARKAREMFEAAAVRYPDSPRWHIFYAGPAPGGVVVGQQLNPTMIREAQLYEFQRPRHIPSITITPHDSSLTRWTVTDDSGSAWTSKSS